MHDHPTRSAFGQILGHPTKPNLRFFFPPDAGDGAGGGSTAGDGGQDGDDDKGVDGPTAKALRDQAQKRMDERNAARDEAKAFKDLGLTVEEIAQLKADRDANNGGPTAEQLQKQAERDAEKIVGEKFAAISRTNAVKTQAALAGFHNPAAALAMLDQTALGKVAVDEQYEADTAAVKKLLADLATAEPYLVKKPEQQTADWRTAGIGGTGSSTRPDPGPGTPRLAAAYAASSTERK